MRISTISERPLARVAVLEPGDLQFGYDAKPPQWKSQPVLKSSYPTGDEVDPWGPAYTHDERLVSELLRECVNAAPLGSAPVTVYVGLWEGLARTNGWSTYDHPYYRDGDDISWWHGPGLKPWEGVIALSGKRIEIHPAVTRYVVAHEYGHVVDVALAQLRYPGDGNAFHKLHEDYRRLRRLPDGPGHYGNGTHHLAVGEVLTNDFRTVVLGRECDFWAHPVTPGWKLKGVRRWWERACADLHALSEIGSVERSKR